MVDWLIDFPIAFLTGFSTLHWSTDWLIDWLIIFQFILCFIFLRFSLWNFWIQIQFNRTQKLAADIHRSYPAGEPLLLVCILKSGLGFFNALVGGLQSLNLLAGAPSKSDHCEEKNRREQSDIIPVNTCHRSRPLLSEFIRVRSYVNDRSTGNVEITGIRDMAAAVADQVLH